MLSAFDTTVFEHNGAQYALYIVCLGLAWIINLLQKWSYEILLYKLSEEHNYFPRDIKLIHKLAFNADLSKLLTYQKSLNKIKFYAKTSVNKEINLNSVMIEYKNIFTN